MKPVITDPSYSYSNGFITYSATVQIVAEAGDPAPLDTVMWTRSVSAKINPDSDDYNVFVQNLIDQAQEIKDRYATKMATMLTITSQPDIDSILTDIKTKIEAGVT